VGAVPGIQNVAQGAAANMKLDDLTLANKV